MKEAPDPLVVAAPQQRLATMLAEFVGEYTRLHALAFPGVGTSPEVWTSTSRQSDSVGDLATDYADEGLLRLCLSLHDAADEMNAIAHDAQRRTAAVLKSLRVHVGKAGQGPPTPKVTHWSTKDLQRLEREAQLRRHREVRA